MIHLGVFTFLDQCNKTSGVKLIIAQILLYTQLTSAGRNK